jgi:hypothetical protein
MDSAMHMCGHGQDMCKGELQVGWLENRCSGSAQWTGSAESDALGLRGSAPRRAGENGAAMAPLNCPRRLSAGWYCAERRQQGH